MGRKRAAAVVGTVAKRPRRLGQMMQESTDIPHPRKKVSFAVDVKCVSANPFPGCR